MLIERRYSFRRSPQRAPLERQHKGFADFPQRDSLRRFLQRGFETFDWFTEWFEAEPKSLMMHRHNELRAGVVRHLDSLLGIAMGADPRVVTTDRHDREIDPLRARRAAG